MRQPKDGRQQKHSDTKQADGEKKKRGRKKGVKNKPKYNDDEEDDFEEEDQQKQKARTTKAERRFRELQEKKMMEFAKNKQKSFHPEVNVSKVDINKNIGSGGGDTDPGDDVTEMQLAQQIKMTDDYKIIEKLQERVRSMEKSIEQSKIDYESAQADLESTRIDLAAERQKSKRLQEQAEKGAEINEEKLRYELLAKKREEVDAAVEEERKRNELEFKSRLNEALSEERSKSEAKIQESVEKGIFYICWEYQN